MEYRKALFREDFEFNFGYDKFIFPTEYSSGNDSFVFG